MNAVNNWLRIPADIQSQPDRDTLVMVLARNRKIIDMTGVRFGKLEVVEFGGIKGNTAMWACKCDCGNTCIVAGSNLRRGHTQSCGCYHRERAGAANITHGMYNTRLYRIWRHMKARCGDLSGKYYPNYGDRGIKICTEWINSFESFCEWALANGYSESLTIDRIDPNGNYEPSNCRWLTMKGQGNNKRNNVYVTINGKTQTMMQWSEELHIRYGTVKYRISKMGMSPCDALTKPLQKVRQTNVKDGKFKRYVEYREMEGENG